MCCTALCKEESCVQHATHVNCEADSAGTTTSADELCKCPDDTVTWTGSLAVAGLCGCWHTLGGAKTLPEGAAGRKCL